jgi:hypothetical protein
MKKELDTNRGFIINSNDYSIIILHNYYIELMIMSNNDKQLYTEGELILNMILLNGNNIVYIDKKDLFKKIIQLIKTDNEKLVESMINTIKEFENENEKNKRIERFKQLIK